MVQNNIAYSSIDTPAVLLDLDKLEANIEEMTRLANDAGVKLRPHIKLHENAIIAKMQIEAATCGIEVGNIAQAQVMTENGIDDILIAHPFYGNHKFEMLKNLAHKPGLKLSVVVDMIEQAEELSRVGEAVGIKIPVFIKIDTGINRYGVLPGIPTFNLAMQLHKLPGIELVGIYAHESGAVPTDEGVAKMALEVGSIMTETARMLRRKGFAIKDVAVGSSPSFRATCRYIKEGLLKEVTEIHPGGSVIGDLMYMKAHANTRDACALTVLTTVVSTSHSGHAVIDAGYKTFSKDPLIERLNTPGFFWEEKPSYGSIQGRSDLWLGKLGAESGWVFYTDSTSPRLILGDRMEIVPNNATLVINIHDQIYGVRNGVVERIIPVHGRGKGS